MGQLYKSSDKAKGGDRGNQHTGGKVLEGDLATLTDMSVSKNQSSRWQKLAESSEKELEKTLPMQTTISRLSRYGQENLK